MQSLEYTPTPRMSASEVMRALRTAFPRPDPTPLPKESTIALWPNELSPALYESDSTFTKVDILIAGNPKGLFFTDVRKPNVLFVGGFRIHEPQRGHGFGMQALRLLTDAARTGGFIAIEGELGFEERARHEDLKRLYRRAGASIDRTRVHLALR